MKQFLDKALIHYTNKESATSMIQKKKRKKAPIQKHIVIQLQKKGSTNSFKQYKSIFTDHIPNYFYEFKSLLYS